MPEQPSPSQPKPPPPAPITRRNRRGLSPVWIIPIIAALLGAWLVWKYYSGKGPEITVRFETAEGVVGGKTPILCRSVNIGTVREVKLTDDLKNVSVILDMTSDAKRLLTKDTQIWIVRARYGASGISGLSTLVSGNYLELQPGVSQEERREFVGLESPPVTPPGVPGLRLLLTSESAGGVGPGTSITYKGITVGKIESRVYHPETGSMEFGAFINVAYANLIDPKTRFWNASGIDLKLGAGGIQLRSGTLESIVSGGITFSDPDKKDLRSRHVRDGQKFVLFDNFDASRRVEFNPTMPYLLLFTGSVRGLSSDAPVEFRGIQVGTVSGISFRYLPNDPERRVPVLIKIDPAAFVNVPAEEYDTAQAEISKVVEKGLRASLKTGSLITGQLYVDLDFQKDAPPAKLDDVEGYAVLPTTGSGLDELEEKVSSLLDKFKALPLEQTVQNANEALAAVKGAASGLDKFLSSKETQALPGDLHKDLQELQKTLAGYNGNSAFYGDLSQTLRQLTEALRSVKALTGTIERSPNSLIFGKPGGVEPPKGSR